MKILVHGFEDYYMSAEDFLGTLWSGNLCGASLECTVTIGNETKTFNEWRKDYPSSVEDKVRKFDGFCLKCCGELRAEAGHSVLNCNSFICEKCGDETPELGSLTSD